MTRKTIIKRLADLFAGCGEVEIRRDLERIPFQESELPRVIINDSTATRVMTVSPFTGNGGASRWNMRVSVLCAAADEDEAAEILAQCAAKLSDTEDDIVPAGEEAPLAAPAALEILGIDLVQHDFAVVQDERRVALAAMILSIDYIGGRWKF